METIDLLLAHLDDLKVQHDAGINPGPDEIALLFDLHASAKLERGRDQARAAVDACPACGGRDVMPPPAALPTAVRELTTVPEVPARRAKARGKRVA